MDGVVAAWRWWRGWPGRDVVLVVAVTVLLLLGSYGEAHPRNPADTIQFGHRPVPQPGAAYVLVAIACLALAWRRRRPVAVLAVSAAAAIGYTLLGNVNGSVLVAPVIALYALATQVSARKAVVAGLVTMVVLTAATAARNPFGHITGGAVDIIPFMVAAVTFAGIAVANRRAYVTSIRARAEADAQRRIDEERLRIARELHDVVSHTMATINVQAGTAAHVLSSRPEVAAEALAAIKSASKEGLRELRAILNLLRQADEADPTQPAPGTAQLGTLVAGARRAGLETTLTVTGTPFPLPAAVDLAAYRIVQESLTNAIRHAGPATAAVSVGYLGDEVRIEVTDTGRGAVASGSAAGGGSGGGSGSAAGGGSGGGSGGAAGANGGGPGHGLAGMRERAAAVGGTVEAGPRPGGGFRVAATLPVTPDGRRP
ncbi:MAG TPA: histidine kinase [Streptosporangiaceae bacterium]|jgi:signal transduction histidine kinase|nr:histidine kinase [Streptosporangiaceae bacterium]